MTKQMKKPGKYLKFYYKCMETGKMRDIGLCNSLGDRVNIFRPSDADCTELFKTNYSYTFWGSGLMSSDDEEMKKYYFTPLRQTIVLFLAAMNNEL